MPRTADRAPRAYEALKNSISEVGVLNPVIVNEHDVVVDGRNRVEIAKELGVDCPQMVRRRATWLAEERIARRRNEQSVDLRTEVIRLAMLVDDDGLGLFTEQAVAQACGVSLRYVIGVLEGLLEIQTQPGQDAPFTFPRRRHYDDEVIVDSVVVRPDEGPERHEVLTYIPAVTADQYAALKADIATNGQTTPILLTPEGLLVDGRARWRICSELGITPVTKVVDGNAWEASLAANRPRFPEYNDRLLITAALPKRPAPTAFEGPPTTTRLAELFDVPAHITKVFRVLTNREGTEGFQKAVLEGSIRLYTAVRVIRYVPEELWPATLRRMLAEAARGVEPSLPLRPDDTPEMRALNDSSAGRARRRRGVIAVPVVDQVRNTLGALGAVLDNSDGLDPTIDAGQAADLLNSLTADRRQLTRLINLLKERKEST